MSPDHHVTTSPRRLTVYLPPELHDAVRERAYRGRTTMSAIVQAALSAQPAPARTTTQQPPPAPAPAAPETDSIVGRVMARHEP